MSSFYKKEEKVDKNKWHKKRKKRYTYINLDYQFFTQN